MDPLAAQATAHGCSPVGQHSQNPCQMWTSRAGGHPPPRVLQRLATASQYFTVLCMVQWLCTPPGHTGGNQSMPEDVNGEANYDSKNQESRLRLLRTQCRFYELKQPTELNNRQCPAQDMSTRTSFCTITKNNHIAPGFQKHAMVAHSRILV